MKWTFNVLQEKHERTKALKALRDQENELSKRLCLPVHNFGQEIIVPNKEQLRELEANIDYFRNELVWIFKSM